MTDKYITVKELRDFGYLQEVNRRFFHPLGLALAVDITEDESEDFILGVLDARDDPEGFIFDPDSVETDAERMRKYRNVEDQWQQRCAIRLKGLGYAVQPIQ